MEYSHNHKQNYALVQRAGLVAALAFSAASSGVAGLIGPGGDAHIWSGAINASWQVGGNWTNGQVPANGDAALINGGPANIFLNADSAQLASLFVAGGLAVSNNGHLLNVTSGPAVATITGLDSRVFVAGAGLGFDVDTLDVESQGVLQLSGGHTRINTQLTLTGGARISGSGLIEVNSTNLVPFNGFGGQSMTATGGELMVTVAGGGAVALPPIVNVLNADSSLVIDGPMFVSVNDVNMGPNTEVSFIDGWSLSGVLSAAPGAGNTARVSGGDFDVDGVIDVDSGEMIIEAPVNFDIGSDVNVASQAVLTIADAHDAAPGQTVSVGPGGVFRITGEQGFGPAWGGDIELTAAAFEVGTAEPVVWRMSGNMELGGLLSFRSRVRGTAPVRLTGDVLVTGAGAEFETDVDLFDGGSMELAQSQTVLLVEASLRQRAEADIFGAGRIEIAETGVMRTTDPVDLDVDVINAGEFSVDGDGTDVGYAYIGGAYTQESSGRLVVQIAGDAPVQRDIYETAGDATLAGDLYVELLDGFVPMMGQTFEVFWVNGVLTGGFETLSGAEGFDMSIMGNTIVLTYIGEAACAGDIDGSGSVDGADLASMLAVWGTADATADLNGDGVVDGADLAAMLANWGACM